MIKSTDLLRRRARSRSSPCTMELTAPILTMVLAATVIPIELRRPDFAQLSFTAFRSDVALNIVGYLPLGLVLATLSSAHAVAAAAAIATAAEASQFFMVHRQPSAVDVICNVCGAILGTWAVRRFMRPIPVLRLERRTAAVAALLSAAVVILVRSQAPLPLNDRGWTAPGTLEAHWKFDESEGRRAADSSGHQLDAAFSNEPERVPGRLGNAVSLNGPTDYADAGRATAFRLLGSMTISAWINSARFPGDDAAIVSSHNGLGYQLDTTVDRGTRTIGFKLGNACGNLMARYGATPMIEGRWYHVAGVFDAADRSLDVYLNGKLDNGFLLGNVTAAQRSSREPVYIGRRSSDRGFEFSGLIDDVRIYSRALNMGEIDADMHGMPVVAALPSLEPAERDQSAPTPCSSRSDPEDSKLPGAAGLLGVLVAMMYLGFWPAAGWLPCLVAGALAGSLLLAAAAPSLPAFGRVMIPISGLAGAFSVMVSLPGRAKGH